MSAPRDVEPGVPDAESSHPCEQDTGWFWRIVDEAGLADVPSDEVAALRLLVRRAASPDGEGWRSIASAPRDGTYIIGARLEDDELRDVGKYLFETRFGESGWLEDERGIASDLTHWRPLPPPPGARPDSAPAVTATPPDIIAAARADERGYLRNEIVSLCEDTEQRYADVAERDTEGKKGAFSRGRIAEAKSIRRAICEVIRIRALGPVPSTDAGGRLDGGGWEMSASFDFYECPECGFSSVQPDTFAGSTACPLCAGDSGHDVGMQCRPAQDEDRPEGFDARLGTRQEQEFARAALRSDQGGL